MKVLKGLFYTSEHEWVKVEGEKAYIGVTDYAQKALGDIVFIELPEVDTEFNAGEGFGVVESVKAASDIYIPIDGTVVEINEAIVDEPGLVNENPYENWMICVQYADKEQIEALMNADEYKEFCTEEE